MVVASALPAPAAAGEDELKKVYQENLSAFTAPEFRKVSALIIRGEDMVTVDSFADEQLKTFYDENIARYRTKETRAVAQILFNSKEEAAAARATMAAGDHLDAIAKKAKTASPSDIGVLSRDDALAKAIGPAFDLAVGEVSEVTETDLGWHLFEIKAITPERVQDFASVKDQIRKTMAEDKATDAIYDASVAVEDGLAGGTPLDDLAQKVGGRVVHIDAMDRQGRDPRGLDAKGLIDNERFIRTAFGLTAGTESKLLEIPKGYYVVRLEAITPPSPRPFEDVRSAVQALADKQSRIAAARAMAAKLVGEIGPATGMPALAKDKSVTFAQVGPVTRFGQGLSRDILIDSKRLGPELLEKLFAAKPGEVVSAPVVDGVVVARLREIVPPGPVGDAAKANAEIENAVKVGIGNDLLTAMNRAFAERYPSAINKAALDKIVSGAR